MRRAPAAAAALLAAAACTFSSETTVSPHRLAKPLPGGLANLCVVRPAAGAEEAFRDPAGTLRRALAAEPLLRQRTADARL
ncbi:MAG TPA: hypothetical protein PLB01_10645, partial [Thermoanaerobaculia bacterium]|nr:hypothetical protein [Thermoanaerobaculia bacterium]